MEDNPTPEEIHEALGHLAATLRDIDAQHRPHVLALIDQHLDLLLDSQCAA